MVKFVSFWPLLLRKGAMETIGHLVLNSCIITYLALGVIAPNSSSVNKG